MQRPLISVTLSAYNVEEYIGDCLQNITNQTLKDIEIICVNDASTDNTLNILEKYAAQDSRITIINKTENEGLAVARNKCIDLAKGKYICFVDGDDLLSLDLCEKAFEFAETNNSDLVMWDYISFVKESEIEVLLKNKSNLKEFKVLDKFALLELPAFAWVKLIRTDVAKNLQINFPVGLTYQDVPVHWKLITKLENINILPEKLSYYRQQPNATTHKKGWKRADYIEVMDIVEKYLHDNELFEEYKYAFLKRRLESMAGVYDVLQTDLKSKALNLILERFNHEERLYIKGRHALRWQTRLFYKSLMGSLSASIQYKGWLLSRTVFRFVKGLFGK